MLGLDIMSGAGEPKMIGDESLFSRAQAWKAEVAKQTYPTRVVSKDLNGDIFGEPCRHRGMCI